MTGSWLVQVKAVRPFTIHGDIYWELQVCRADQQSPDFLLRVPQHAARTEPEVAQKLKVTFLMGQVTAVAVLD